MKDFGPSQSPKLTRLRDNQYCPGPPCVRAASPHHRKLGAGRVHNDHLSTPKLITDQNQAIVWTADVQAFGTAVTSGALTFNVRFPGQYFDQETGLHYNYFRYYDPTTGRYITSDPIGLQGGLNTYAYGGNSPIRYIDPFGLTTFSVSVNVTGGGVIGGTLGLNITFAPNGIQVTSTKGGGSFVGGGGAVTLSGEITGANCLEALHGLSGQIGYSVSGAVLVAGSGVTFPLSDSDGNSFPHTKGALPFGGSFVEIGLGFGTPSAGTSFLTITEPVIPGLSTIPVSLPFLQTH